ncbi:ASTN2 protein, partial [Polypterus senegalus]
MQLVHYKLVGCLCISAKAGEERSGSGMAGRVLFLLGVLVAGTWAGGGGVASGGHHEEDAESPCEVKTVTVSTLPVLRENEFSFTGGGASSLAGGGAGESRLLLFVRTDLPGRISVLDDLDNTALPYFTLVNSLDDLLFLTTASDIKMLTLDWFEEFVHAYLISHLSQQADGLPK